MTIKNNRDYILEISFSLERKGEVENASKIKKFPQFPGISWKNQGEAKTKALFSSQ